MMRTAKEIPGVNGNDQLASEPLARAHDSLVVEVDMCVLD
jgi:hypothetical protein